jgi:hypothetical protein
MRLILCILASISFLASEAQMHLPVGSFNYAQWQPFPAYNHIIDSNNVNQKWYFSTYGAISAGYGYFNGGGSTFVSAPVGLQVNRQLNNNLIAFAGISAAPTFFSFSRSFTDPAFYKSYQGGPMSNAYGFGINSRVEMGLMYINDAKTFSISGSIGVERGSYPVYPTETKKVNKR